MGDEEYEFDQELLLAVVETLIPGRNVDVGQDIGAGMPAASHLEEFREIPNAEVAWIYGPLLELLREQEAHWDGGSFASMDLVAREAVLRQIESAQPTLLRGVMLQTVIRYYRTEAASVALGLEARPPFPQGYAVEETDCSLLDPVREMKPIYRLIPVKEEEK